MRLLLDTHVVIWWFTGNPRLSARISDLIKNPECDCYISAISAYEISNKIRIGKLHEAEELEKNLIPLALNSAMQFLPVEVLHAQFAARFPSEFRDPFDRIIAAQSLVEQIDVATIDKNISKLGGLAIW